MSSASGRNNAGRSLTAQSLLFLVFVGVVFAFVGRVGDPAHPFLDTDLWWHLANGRYILAHGVPGTDVYSHTAIGHVWVVHEWLSDVAFYLLYAAGGLRVLVLVTALAVAVGMVLVYRGLRTGGLGTTPAVVLAMVLFVASVPSFGARPQVINFVLTGALCAVLLRYRARPSSRVWWLFPAFIVWANLHSGYIVGVGLLAVFTVSEALQVASARVAALRQEGVEVLRRSDVRRLWLLIPLGFLSGLFTPGTYRTLFFAFGTLSSQNIQSFIVEWFSPDFHQVQGKALLVCLLVLVAGLVATRRGTRSGAADPTYLAWGLVALTLALTSQRHVPIFAIAAAPLLGGAAAGLMATLGVGPRRVRRPTPAMARVNVALLVVLAVVELAFLTSNLRQPVIDGVVAAVEPAAATNWMLTHRPRQTLFNNYSFGGWLDWQAAPRYPVFIDGRIEVYGDRVFNDYLTVESLADGWSEVLERYRVRTIMVTPGDRLALVLPSRGWTLAYRDRVAVVYTHE
ncbi:MAG: hypothetical protein NVSMB17_14210 [Candidatus Dormibacteria bacterium]